MTDRLDGESAARVLRRASEIEHAHLDPAQVVEDSGGVSGEALIDAAEEVGINPDAVRDALALERFDDAAPDAGRLDRIVGPASVTVEHVVHQTPGDAVGAIEAWLTSAHRMRCVRDADGVVECRPRRGLNATIGRTITSITGEVNIRSIDRVVVDAEALHVGATADQPRTLVRVVAVRQSSRSRRIGGGSAVGLAGAGSAAAAVAGPVPLLSVLAVGLRAGGYVVARSGSTHAELVELELMRILSAVDRGDRPTGLVGRAARRASDAVSESLRSRRRQR